jgi:hypothetical protein
MCRVGDRKGWSLEEVGRLSLRELRTWAAFYQRKDREEIELHAAREKSAWQRTRTLADAFALVMTGKPLRWRGERRPRAAGDAKRNAEFTRELLKGWAVAMGGKVVAPAEPKRKAAGK